MVDKEYLVKVFEDTEKIVNSGAFDNVLFSSKEMFDVKKRNPLVQDVLNDKKGLVTVDNMDCVSMAQTLSYAGKTCILNMASHYRPGGGVKNGARAQEEELCRRSNLIFGLEYNSNNDLYPIQEDEYLYTKDVTFFKDGKYQVCEPFDLDVITIPAINLNKEKDKWLFEGNDKEYKQYMQAKVLATIIRPMQAGCVNLVLSAFGCGVFKNDPNFVSELYREYLYDFGMRYFFNRISFAIINDQNATNNNFGIFKKILKDE